MAFQPQTDFFKDKNDTLIPLLPEQQTALTNLYRFETGSCRRYDAVAAQAVTTVRNLTF